MRITPELWERVCAALDRAEKLTGGSREAYLRQLHRDDPPVAKEVETLLREQELSGGGISLGSLAQQVRDRLRSRNAEPELPCPPRVEDLTAEQAGAVEAACSRYERDWQTWRHRWPRVEDYLQLVDGSLQGVVMAELVRMELSHREQLGQAVGIEEYLERFPGQGWLLELLSQPGGDRSANGASTSLTPTVSFPGPQQGTLPPAEAPAGKVKSAVSGYELIEELGRGGMGVVYRARHTALDRIVALKMILAGDHADEGTLRRFQTEGEAVARLQHPHIVQIFEVGRREGLPFYSLEYCPKGSLDRLLGGTPIGPVQAASLLTKLARAVEAAHQKNVIHRDLKPANILFAEDGTPKITDFGLAKKIDEQDRTATGAVMGSPPYMPPEQAMGETRSLGPACDVYSLGAILYECLTGRPPFKAASVMDTLRQVISSEPVPPSRLNPKVPRDLETVCLKCLEKEPRRRYATAADLEADLDRFLRHQPVRARPIGPAGRLTRWCRRNPVVAALSATALAMTAAVLIVLASSNLRIGRALESERAQQKKAEQALHDSLKRQVRALWLAREPGWREQALTALQQAAEIRSDPALRDLAIQTLSSWDWAPVSRHELPAATALLAVGPNGRDFAVAAGSQILRGQFGLGGAVVGAPKKVANVPGQTQITQLRFGPQANTLAWSTRAGGVYLKRDGEEVRVLRQPDGQPVLSLTFGPGPGQLAWTCEGGLAVWDIAQGSSKGLELRTHPPDVIVRNNPDALRDPAIRDQACLVADPRGRFLIGSGTRQEPTIWITGESGLSHQEVAEQVPTGSNLHLATSPDGNYLYLACNEPRWGSEQIGGRLPPWAKDPLTQKPVVEPPSAQPDDDPSGTASERSPQEPRKGRNPASQVSSPPAVPAPAGPHEGRSGLSQVGADGSGGSMSKEPPPPVGVGKEPPPPIGEHRATDRPASEREPGGDTDAGRRPLSPLLSGPVRRAYLYQFEVQRNREAPLDGQIRVKRLDPRTVDEFHIFRIGDVTGLSVASNGEVLLAGSSGKAILLRPAPPRLEQVAEITVPHTPLRAAAFLEGSTRTVFSVGQRSLDVWERQGLEHNQLVRVGLQEDSPFTPWSKVAVSKVAGQLSVANWENKVELRDLKSGRLLVELPRLRYVRDLAWSPDGSTLVMATPEDQAALQLSPFHVLTKYDLSGRTLEERALDAPIACVHIDPSGRRLCGLRDAGIRVVPETKDLPPAPDAPARPERSEPQPQFPDGRTPTVTRVVFDPAGDRLAALTSDGGVQLWGGRDFRPGRRHDLNGSQGRSVNDICFRPGAPELIAATTDSRLVVLSEEVGPHEEIETQSEILRVTLDLSGRYLLCGGRDGSLSLWNFPSRKQILRWIGHEAPTGFVGFEPEGRLLSAALDGEIRRWDLPGLRRGVEGLGIEWEAGQDFDWQAEAVAATGSEDTTAPGTPTTDPRKRLGRRVGDKLLMKIRREVEVPVEKTIEVDGQARVITVTERRVVIEERAFDADEPLPDLDYIPYESESEAGPP